MGVQILKRPNPDYRIRKRLLKEAISKLRIEGQGGPGKEGEKAKCIVFKAKRTAYAKPQRYHNWHGTDRTQRMRGTC